MQKSHDDAVRHMLHIWGIKAIDDNRREESYAHIALSLNSGVQKLYITLKSAMHHIKLYDSDKMKRAIRRMIFLAPKNLRLCLALWKNGAEKKH